MGVEEYILGSALFGNALQSACREVALQGDKGRFGLYLMCVIDQWACGEVAQQSSVVDAWGEKVDSLCHNQNNWMYKSIKKMCNPADCPAILLFPKILRTFAAYYCTNYI